MSWVDGWVSSPGRGDGATSSTGGRRVAVAEDPSAVLLIRVWLEGDERAFRARLSGIGGPGGGAAPEENTVAVAASPQDVLAAVEQWLADFVRGSEDERGH